jgi:hypothetical protein
MFPLKIDPHLHFSSKEEKKTLFASVSLSTTALKSQKIVILGYETSDSEYHTDFLLHPTPVIFAFSPSS